MDSKDISATQSVDHAGAQVPESNDATLSVDVYESASANQKEHLISQMVAEVFETAPLPERSRLLGHLLQPLGLLSLMAIANGIFAKIRFRSGWPAIQIPIDEVRNVQASDVIALVNWVQGVSVQAVDNLVQILTTSPVMTRSAVAAVLVTILMKRAKTRRADDAHDFP